MKCIIRYLAAAAMMALILLVIFLLQWIQMPPFRRQAGDTPTAPTVQQIQQLSALMTLRMEVADVQETRITGYTGAVKAVLVLKGDLLLGVDLSQAKLLNLNPQTRTATLVLPPPQVTSPRVDHERTRLFAVTETGLWKIVPGDAAHAAAVSEALREAQQVVALIGQDPILRNRCRRQTEDVLRCFYQALGWEITLRWSDQ